MASPIVGSIVHFHEDGGPYAAVVTAVNQDGSLELATLGRNSLYFQHNVTDPGLEPGAPLKGHWTWPPRT